MLSNPKKGKTTTLLTSITLVLGNYRVRKTLESWHTAKTVDAENNSKPLPRQYSTDFIVIRLFFTLFFTPFSHLFLYYTF